MDLPHVGSKLIVHISINSRGARVQYSRTRQFHSAFTSVASAKTRENKTGPVTGDNHSSPLPSHVNRPVAVKLTGAGDDLIDNHKKKDVFRPSVLDTESGRRDRWRDEERDTNSSVRKDRWKEGEREHGDNRRVDRKVDSSGRHYGEARRASGERWTDSGNRENHDQRRETKWNTRWGPDDKEADAVREKWGDSNIEDDVLLDKGSSHIPSHGKDERDGDQYRPWRPNSSYSRGRADPHHQTLTPNKQVPTFSHGRGRGENPAPSFSLGRGKFSPGGNSVTHTAKHVQPHGPLIEKGETGYGELHSLNYSRTKLIDIYRTTDMISCAKYLEGIVQVPSLTQEVPIEPLAFCPPTPEELVILKGIEKGEIIASGAPQVSKDGSAGRNTTDFMQSRRNRLGSGKDDLPFPRDDSKHDTLDNPDGYSDYSEGLTHEKHIHRWPEAKVETMHKYQPSSDHKLNAEGALDLATCVGCAFALKEDSAMHRKNDDVSAARESSTPEHSSNLHTGSWRSSSFADRSRLTSGWRDLSTDIQKDFNNVWQNSTIDSPNTKKGGPKWQVGDDPVLRRQPSAEPHITSHPSPEDLVLYYKDPQNCKFVWRCTADFPFSLLGDVMPHLRAKARPPPGFSTPKANDIQDVSGRLNYTDSGKLHAVASEADVLKNDSRYKHGSTTEVENRFLESLMAGSLSTGPFEKFALSEGMQGYGGNNSFVRPPLGSNSGDDPYLLANKLTLERQRSLSNPYSLWPGRDAASIAANTDSVNETALAHSKLLSSIADNARAQHHSQNVESMSVLQGLYDRSTSTVNNGTGGWVNFPSQRGLDPLQEKLDIRQSQNIPPQSALSMIQQRLQPQNASLSNLLAQSLDNSSRMLTPEKLLTSAIPQDPQILSLLQQQYLLQAQSQAPVASHQLSILDMMLKQQQKQEEQQQLMRQQQQLLSQVLSEHHHNQLSGDPSFAQVQTGGFATGNANLDHNRFQQHDFFQIGSQVQAPNMHDENASAADLVLPPRDSQDIRPNMVSENSVHLPHQMFTNTVKQKNWDASPAEQIVEQPKGLSCTIDDMDLIPISGKTNKFVSEQTSNYDESVRVLTTDVASSFPARKHLGESVSQQQFAVDHPNELLTHETVEALPETMARALAEPRDIEEKNIGDFSVVKEVKNPEAREVKKSSEKKSKKQKSSKAPTDSVRAVSKSQQSKSSEYDGTTSGNAKSETVAAKGDVTILTEKEKTKTKKVADDVDSLPGQSSLPALNYADDGVTVETKAQPGQIAHTSQVNIQAHAGQRAWKDAPGFRTKSLLEIQQEEQRRAQEKAAVSEISTSLSSMNLSTPWAGVVVNADHKALNEIRQDAASIEINFAKSDSSSTLKNKNSQNEDLFWDSNVSKLGDREMDISNSGSAKAKNAGAKTAPVVAASDVSVGSSPNDKGKHARQMQQQKEVLPAPPSGPSFGDFVTWKGESVSPPAPAWSDSGKSHKPASMRDILKEQERKVSSSLPVPTPQKPATSQPARGSGPSWSYSTSPAKAASPLTINSQTSSQSKHKVEDDLFWGPLEQPKQDDKQLAPHVNLVGAAKITSQLASERMLTLLEFPQLGTQGSWGSKSTPVKGNLGGPLNRQKSTGGKPADYSLSASASIAKSSQKGKKNAVTKNSEAIDFKEWCESECIRLIGSKDTSILEYCLKISRSEAETLLIENLGSFDTNHEFIDKFLSYKDFLPADVLDIAFKNRNDRKATASGVGDMISDHADVGGSDPVSVGANDGTTKGGKKKGKKGKKVSPSVLGFNVVSNRIMMGEIQTVDE
ncbi:hypothetical protein DH2020_035084 [Rehmannia glutinosa]|uniref:GYF domain-containing protein n=1 Tax=Rehmannia glutinosa TaxID=99300 RepID=A0ABR0V9S4_REHGL